ncbi:hypothetical protein [Streptococcus ovuberis]|uniref:Lipoprotein n=1 Tax=Streptococcus ovuberis TaxID=1936207 RepID=A0A7X6MZ25_9STRE|nr:hypothetical protein [Streptococcus ovuberis]NKZ20511.1 hypothetical protein [Streptococcus ovuberis]
MRYLSKISIVVVGIYLLSACTYTSVDKEVMQQVKNEVAKELSPLEQSIEDKVLYVPNQEQYTLTDEFSGTIYLMASRKQIEKGADQELFELNHEEMTPIDMGSDDDFNIRYDDKTWFSIQKIAVDNLKDFTMNTRRADSYLLVFRDK